MLLLLVALAVVAVAATEPARIGTDDGSNIDLFGNSTRVHTPLIVEGVDVMAVIAAQQSTVTAQQSTITVQQSTITGLQSTATAQQSTITAQQSADTAQQSTIVALQVKLPKQYPSSFGCR